MPLDLEIVTPEKSVYTGSVNAVVLPTSTGEIGILPGHIPLVGILEPGEIEVDKPDGKREWLAVDRGYIQVAADKVSVLTEAAIDVEHIDGAMLEDARTRAEKALAEARVEGFEPDEVERLEAHVRFALTQEMVYKKRMHR